MKTTYTITEKQGANSYREGQQVQAKTLAAAKAMATKWQFFQGTVMEIKDSAGIVLAIKENGKWREFPRAKVLYRISHRPAVDEKIQREEKQ